MAISQNDGSMAKAYVSGRLEAKTCGIIAANRPALCIFGGILGAIQGRKAAIVVGIVASIAMVMGWAQFGVGIDTIGVGLFIDKVPR